MIKTQKIKTIILFSIFCFLFSLRVDAAKLTLSSSSSDEITVGGQFKINLFLSSENDDINAVEGKIKFPENIKLFYVSDGGSIISFWAEKPVLKGNEVSFAGVIPGGYSGSNGLVFSMIFEPERMGDGIIKIADARTLLNDGQGMPTPVSVSDFLVKIVNFNPLLKKPEIKTEDTEKPETFSPQITSDQNIFNGKWFLIFATQDKNSGIDYYAVKEVRHFRFWELGFWKKQPEINWQKTESPYLLTDQSLKSDIFVKAVDKAGNEMIIALPAQLKSWYKNPLVDIIIGLGIVIVVLLNVWLWRKYIKKRE